MKAKDFKKLTPYQQKLVRELAAEQPESLFVRSSGSNKGTSGLPLFEKQDSQTSLF